MTTRRKTWMIWGMGMTAIGTLSLSSLAVASLLPGGPDLFSILNGTSNSSLSSILGGGEQPWSEQLPLPGRTGGDPLGGLLGNNGSWGEQLPGGLGGIASDALVCQLIGDFGSLPIAIPGLPSSRCSTASQTTAQIPTPPGTIPEATVGTGAATMGTTGPDPTEVRGQAPAPPSEASKYDALTVNPIVRQRDWSNLYDQKLSRSTAAPMVGKTGTRWLLTSAASTNEVILNSQRSDKAVQQLAESSKSLSVTQDVIKNSSQMQQLLAAMMVDQAVLTGKSHASLLGLQQETGMVLLNQANLSEGIDEMNRRERSDRLVLAAAAARAPLYLPGLYPPDVTGGK